DQVLGAADPFQGGERVLGGLGDGGLLRPPGGEGLAGRERGGLAPHAAGGGVASGDFLGEQDAQDLGGVPPRRAGGGQRAGGGFAQVGQPHPAEQRVELVRQRRGRRAGHRVLLAGKADLAGQGAGGAAEARVFGRVLRRCGELRPAVRACPGQEL